MNLKSISISYASPRFLEMVLRSNVKEEDEQGLLRLYTREFSTFLPRFFLIIEFPLFLLCRQVYGYYPSN